MTFVLCSVNLSIGKRKIVINSNVERFEKIVTQPLLIKHGVINRLKLETVIYTKDSY